MKRTKPPKRRNTLRSPGKPKVKACSGCGETFTADPPYLKCCSRECQHTAQVRAAQRPGRKPIESKAVPRTCVREGCETTFLVTPARLGVRKYCSRSCADAMKRVEQPARRRGKNNPNYRHGHRQGVRVRADEPNFVDPAGRCRHPDCVGGGWDLCQHHVVYRQEIRRRGAPELDGRDALSLCRSCHTSHHRGGVHVVPLAVLRDENYEYARELMGAGAAYEYLRRHYKGEDSRLDALLAEWEAS